MNNLLVDVGNTSVKVAVFKNRTLVLKETSNELNLHRIGELCAQFEIDNSLVSTVKDELSELEKYLSERSKYIRFNHSTPLPIQNFYQSPQTLGLDRLAALVAVSNLYPKKNTLVVDAGTCITYDLLEANASYFGGSISPGLHMRLKALHEFTGRLPLVPLQLNFTDLVGKNTEQSILSGVLNGASAELYTILTKYQEHYGQLEVVLCGGDAHFFDSQLKNSIFASKVSLIPDLVLIGLNEIIHHQYD